MFSRLLGSTTDDANNIKLEFRSNLPRLANEPLSRDDSKFWRQFFQAFDAPSEIAALLPAELLRAAITRQPGNVALLFEVCVQRLSDLLASPTFPSTSSSSIPALSLSGWMGSGSNGSSSNATSASQINSTKEFMNAARVLCRLLPLLFERLQTHSQHVLLPEDQANRNASADWVHQLLWKRRVVPLPGQQEQQQQQREEAYARAAQFVIDDEEEEEEDPATAKPAPSEPPAVQTTELPSLGEQLLNTVLDSLFVNGFTLPQNAGKKVQPTIWEAGIGQTAAPAAANKTQLNARAEMLRLLLSMLSGPIYAPNLAVNEFQDRLLRLSNRKLALTILCSLLNTALHNQGGGMQLLSTVSSPSSVYSKLSELALQPKTEDLVDVLPALCFQLIDVLLLPTPATSPTPDPASTRPTSPAAMSASLGTSTSSSAGQTDGSQQVDNVFRLYLGKLHRPSDFDFVWRNVCQALQGASSNLANPVSLIPGLSPSRQNIAECLTLLWRFMDCNKAFLAYLLTDSRPGQLMVLLLNICLDLKDTPAHFNVIRLCAFILQSLSAEKAFAVHLNKPIASIPGGNKHAVVQNGTAADFLITSVATMIFTTHHTFNVVYPSFVLCISNCSAFLKGLSVIASTKMLQLFLAFSAPAFILAEEGNPRLVYYLLEAFNYIIHYQLAANPNLIYAIIQSHRRFENLSTFTLKSAVEDIRRVRSERRSTSSPASPTSESNPSELKSMPSVVSLVGIGTFPAEDKSYDEEDPVRMSEKARGKMRARSESVDGEHADPGFPGPYRSQSGFIPTENWVASWQEHLPLDSILILLSELRPKVESLCSAPSRSTTQAVLDFLQSVTLIDQLPTPPPLRPRRFQQSAFSARWLTALVWGLVYVTNVAVFFNTRVALFQVASAQSEGVVAEAAQAFNRVGSAVGTAVMQRMPSDYGRPRSGDAIV